MISWTKTSRKLAIFGPYTGFNFTPDDQYIIIWAGGGIQRINVQTMEVSSIPFHATAVHPIGMPCTSNRTLLPIISG